MDVKAFPRYNSDQTSSGYTLFKPGDMINPNNGIVSPNAVNVGFDSLLRKVFPNLPLSPSYVREHGLYDAMNNMADGVGDSYSVDLGNIERGRPILINNRLMGNDDPNTIDRGEMLERMYKHSSEKNKDLKNKVRKLINGENTSHKPENSMLSENFLKSIGKNKKNEKVAGVGRVALNGVLGFDAASNIGGARESAGNGNILGTLKGVSDTASDLSFMNGLGTAKTMGRLGAIGLPGAVASTVEDLGDLGRSWEDKSILGVAGNGLKTVLDGGMAYSNAVQGAQTYKSLAGAIGRNAPGLLNSAKNIVSGASEVAAPTLARMGSTAGSVAPELLTGAGSLASRAAAPLALAYMGKQTYDIVKDPSSIDRHMEEMSHKGALSRAMSGLGNAPLTIAAAGKGLYDLGKVTLQNAAAPNEQQMRDQAKQYHENYVKTHPPTAPVQAQNNPVPPAATETPKETPKTPALDAALGKGPTPTPSPTSTPGTVDNNKTAPLPEQNSGIPSLNSNNSAPVAGAGNKSTPDFDGPGMLKQNEEKIVEAPSIPSVKPMEHIPRPENNTLVQTPDFAGQGIKDENAAHNRAILEAKTEQRKALGLPPNPFIGKVVGVQQTTGGVTTHYKPSSNATVTDQNEMLDRATPMHQSKVDQADMGGGLSENSGYKVNPTGNGGSQLIGPDGKVHGTMQVTPGKVAPKQGELKRRNTGIGDWVNPEDFKYLSKSAAYSGVTPQEYIELPLAEEPDTIVNFFTPFG